MGGERGRGNGRQYREGTLLCTATLMHRERSRIRAWGVGKCKGRMGCSIFQSRRLTWIRTLRLHS